MEELVIIAGKITNVVELNSQLLRTIKNHHSLLLSYNEWQSSENHPDLTAMDQDK